MAILKTITKRRIGGLSLFDLTYILGISIVLSPLAFSLIWFVLVVAWAVVGGIFSAWLETLT